MASKVVNKVVSFKIPFVAIMNYFLCNHNICVGIIAVVVQFDHVDVDFNLNPYDAKIPSCPSNDKNGSSAD